MSRPRPAWRPPTRDGVGPSRVATLPGPWATTLAFLVDRLPAVSRDDWRERLHAGRVLDAEGRAVPPDAPHRPNSHLWYWRELPPEPESPEAEAVLHVDEHLVVADKPHGLPMTPKGRHLQQTLLVRLKRRLGLDDLVPIHRLDMDTAGVCVFSVRPDSRAAYQRLFADRAVRKVYEAVAPWRAALAAPRRYASRLEERADAFMQMQEVAGSPNAVTEIEMLTPLGGGRDPAPVPLAHYRLMPHTGRKHQLRAQLAALGAPIVGDRLYPVLMPADAPADETAWPLQLLARTIAFADPIDGRPRRFESMRRLAALDADGA